VPAILDCRKALRLQAVARTQAGKPALLVRVGCASPFLTWAVEGPRMRVTLEPVVEQALWGIRWLHTLSRAPSDRKDQE